MAPAGWEAQGRQTSTFTSEMHPMPSHADKRAPSSRARRTQSKGQVERTISYLKTSFLALRAFESQIDLRSQHDRWLLSWPSPDGPRYGSETTWQQRGDSFQTALGQGEGLGDALAVAAMVDPPVQHRRRSFSKARPTGSRAGGRR